MQTIRTVAHASPEYWETVELRRRILRTPLGLDFTPGELANEVADFHVAGFDQNRLVGCLVLTPLDGVDIKMRQVAVDDRIQRRGIGTGLVAFSESFARSHGFRRMVLNARDTAVPFYTRLDYNVEGDPFVEVGVPHSRMVKDL